jgi:nucleotide-binding universal stress UspA family protein
MFQKILVATDGSGLSQLAAVVAIEPARGCAAPDIVRLS